MSIKSRVAVLRVEPETILDDIEKLMDLAGVRAALDASRTTILKDNISWHFPFPGANTTPWQLEGTIRALRNAGFADITCVQNKTVVTNAFKGEDLNRYLPIFERYRIPVLYNFRDADMAWVEYKPKAKMLVLDRIFPEGIRIPDYFLGKNIVHLPTTKCVTGDTELVMADGSIRTIREIVSEQEAAASEHVTEVDGDERVRGELQILAMDPSGRIGPHKATWFWRTQRGERRLFRLRTRSGRTVTATADHLIYTPEGWHRIGEMELGNRVAIARQLTVHGTPQQLPTTHASRPSLPIAARAGTKYGAAFADEVLSSYQAGQTTTAIAQRAGVKWQSIQALLKRHRVSLRRNIKQITIPYDTSVEFWRWLGYLIAEGCIEASPKGSHKLWWVNSQEEIRDDFVRLTQMLFGLECKVHRDGRSLHVYSRSLGSFLEQLGLPVPLNAANKRVPQLLFRATDEEVAAFLSAYLDGDGTVSGKQAELSAVTKSPRLARDLQILFSRFGAVAFVRPVMHTIKGKWEAPRRYFRVSVSGDSFLREGHHFRFKHPGKGSRLDRETQRLMAGKQPSNWDVVPISRDGFREVREGLGFTQASTGRPSSTNKIENGPGLPTPRVARGLIDVLASADIHGEFAERIRVMQRISSEDLAWDRVEAIEPVERDDIELFDLTVPGAESFIGNGIVLHNCHIYTTTTGAMKNAFGGLLNTKRHYTHSWIHATLVDLLAIQREIHTGLFAVMDGTTAGNGPGPRTMFPVVKNFMLASADQVAIDAVSAKMMGFDPMSLEYIRLAHEAKLGVGRPEEIEVVGADIRDENWGFRVGDNGASRVGDLLWFGPLKGIQNFFFRTPLVNIFILGSEAYHDFYRWPAKDRHAFERWLRDTPWGKLFQRYASSTSPASTRSAD